LVTVSSYTERQDFSGAALVVDGLGEPGQPPRVLDGGCSDALARPLHEAGCVDLGVLRALHGCVYGTGAG
jgi:hypothetical protein